MRVIKYCSNQTPVSQPRPLKLHNDDSRTTVAVSRVDSGEVKARGVHALSHWHSGETGIENAQANRSQGQLPKDLPAFMQDLPVCLLLTLQPWKPRVSGK